VGWLVIIYWSIPIPTEKYIVLHDLRLKDGGRKSDVTEVCTSVADPRDLFPNKGNIRSLIGSNWGLYLERHKFLISNYYPSGFQMGTTLRPFQLLRQYRNSSAEIVACQDNHPVSCAPALLLVVIGHSFDVLGCRFRKLS